MLMYIIHKCGQMKIWSNWAPRIIFQLLMWTLLRPYSTYDGIYHQKKVHLTPRICFRKFAGDCLPKYIFPFRACTLTHQLDCPILLAQKHSESQNTNSLQANFIFILRGWYSDSKRKCNAYLESGWCRICVSQHKIERLLRGRKKACSQDICLQYDL